MYVEKRLALKQVGAGAADDLSSAAIHSESYAVLAPMAVSRFMALVSTVMDGAATVILRRRPIFGVAANEVTLATLIIPTLTAVGQVVFKDFNEVELSPGEELIYEVTSQATSGGALYDVDAENDPEAPANDASMVVSA